MKPHRQKILEWYADPMFLIPIAVILAMAVWTILRNVGY